MIYEYISHGIFTPRDYPLKNDDRLLVKTLGRNWFLVKRSGERSWVAECVAESGEADYKRIETHTVNGNSKSIMQVLDNAHIIEDAYIISSVKEYRMALISILATGDINAVIEVNMVVKSEP